MNTISGRLKEERKRLGYSQEKFAALAGVTRRPYAAWEAGETSPTAVNLSALSAVGADVLYILTGERRGSPDKASAAMFVAEPKAEYDVERPSSRRAAALLDNYEHLSEEDKRALERMAFALARQNMTREAT
jgi:transcriptional regulator with XRE-family HTH domain